MNIDTLAGRQHASASWASVGVLSFAAVIFVTAELLPVGILHEIGTAFGQSVGSVGLMVTGYGWTVALSAVLVTGWLAPVERKRLLLALLVSFACANLLVAWAPSLPVLLAARVLGAFSHGVFWSIVGSLAVRLAGRSGTARAIALVFGGIAVAMVAAVPAGSYLAQLFGWRLAFVSIAVCSGLSAALAACLLPFMPSQAQGGLHSLGALRGQRGLLRLFPATALALTGHFCAFTYIGPILERSIGISHAALPGYLLAFGLAGLLGNGMAGRLSDRRLHAGISLTLAGMAAAVAGLLLLGQGQGLAALLLVLAWGAGICMLTVGLQSRVLALAPPQAVDTASSIHVAMFNTGIGSGAFLGGLLVDRLPSTAAAGLGAAALALALCIVAWPMRSSAPPPEPAAP